MPTSKCCDKNSVISSLSVSLFQSYVCIYVLLSFVLFVYIAVIICFVYLYICSRQFGNVLICIYKIM